MILTQQRLREVLRYDPESGHFHWRLREGLQRVPAGSRAGGFANGYRYIRIDHNRYAEHRLAFLYQTGFWPPEDVDHVNGKRGDNRWRNLRLASRSQNLWNGGPNKRNKSGVKGVFWNSQKRRWHATFNVNRKVHLVGFFTDLEEARRAVEKARLNCHGPFANFGQNPNVQI